MRISDMTDQHLLNAKKYWERMLANAPDEQSYMGSSDFAEQAVENENRHNENIKILIENRIRKINREIKKKGLKDL